MGARGAPPRLLKKAALAADWSRVRTAAGPLPTPALGRPRAADRIPWARAYLRREGLLIAAVAIFLGFTSAVVSDLVAPDSWLTLVGGRELAAHGLPGPDGLAVITHGYRWIDQQWLAQLAYWGTYRLGGIRADLLLTILLQLLALVLAIGAARRRGASANAVAPFVAVPVFDVLSVMRAQVFSMVFFVALLVLLAGESRRPSRRVWLAFPLLLVWANTHGAVVVGAVLTALLGACELGALLRSRRGRRRAWIRPLVLAAAPWPVLLATPWSADMLGYYRSTIGNRAFREFQSEWMAPTFPTLAGFALFVLAGAAVFLFAKRPRDLNAFELGALLFTLVGGLFAARSIPWFAYSCLVLLPPLAARVLGPDRPNRLRAGLALAAAPVALALFLAAAAAPESRLTRDWPPAASAAVAKVLASDPHARVFATHQFADWLLFEHPALRGRVAFDGRWEMLSQQETETLVNYLWQIGDGWERPSLGYRVLVLSPRLQQRLAETFDRRGLRVLYRDRTVVVYDRGRATTTSPSR